MPFRAHLAIDRTYVWLRWASAVVAVLGVTLVGRRFIADLAAPRRRRRARERCPECRLVRHELHEAYALADAARRAERRLIATIAEDMRTPFGRRAATASLALDASVPELPRWTIDGIERPPKSPLASVDRVIEPPRRAAASGADAATTFDVRESVGAIVKSSARRAYEKPIDLTYEVGATVAETLRGDLRGFRRALRGLVDNAIQCTADGEVTVQVTATADAAAAVELHVAVGDTGVGLTVDRQRMLAARLVDAVGEGAAYSAGRSELECAAGLVRHAGGRFWVDSTPGQGTVIHFTMRFDVVDPAKPRAPAIDARLRDLPVLVVEDHPTTRRVLVETLSAWGMRAAAVEGAALAQAAIESARSAARPFEIVLIDERILGLDGVTFAERLRRDVDFRGTLIGLLGADAERAGAARWLQLGASRCLTKPVTPAELWSAIASTLAESPRGRGPIGIVSARPMTSLRPAGRMAG